MSKANLVELAESIKKLAKQVPDQRDALEASHRRHIVKEVAMFA